MSFPVPSSRPANAFPWGPLVLLLLALVLRVLTQQQMLPSWWLNFSPLMALAFAGSVVFPRTLPWWSWAVALLIVDWIVAGSSWWTTANGRFEVILAYGCYAAAAFAGSRLRGKAGMLDTLLGTLVCCILFFLVTNTLSWLVEPGYAKTFGGWQQAMTTGLPGYPSTLTFFRNSLIADMTGAAVLVLVYNTEALFRGLWVMPLLSGLRRAA